MQGLRKAESSFPYAANLSYGIVSICYLYLMLAFVNENRSYFKLLNSYKSHRSMYLGAESFLYSYVGEEREDW